MNELKKFTLTTFREKKMVGRDQLCSHADIKPLLFLTRKKIVI